MQDIHMHLIQDIQYVIQDKHIVNKICHFSYFL